MKNSTPNSPKTTEIVLLLDRSGSMGPLRDATIRGVNEFLDGQRVVSGEAFVSIYQFDHEFGAIYEAAPAGSAPPITEANYQPRGSTALLDAIGETVERTRLRVDCCEDDPRVVLAIMTDGLENASRRFGRRAVQRLLSACERQGWQILFLGANMDAVAEGRRMGLSVEKSASFDASPAGATFNMRCVGAKIATLRTTGDVACMDFSPSERADLMQPPE